VIYLLFFGIAIVSLLVWAATVDRKRRRRANLGHDINAAARTARIDAERRGTEWDAGGGR
jgi:hypothetical protein